jgi:hypothetical protein
VYIPADKHAALKAWAKDRGMLLSAAVDEAITSYMIRKRVVTATESIPA